MYRTAGTTDIEALLKTQFPTHMQTWLWLDFFAFFAVEDTDVAGPHLVAGRARRSAHLPAWW